MDQALFVVRLAQAGMSLGLIRTVFRCATIRRGAKAPGLKPAKEAGHVFLGNSCPAERGSAEMVSPRFASRAGPESRLCRRKGACSGCRGAARTQMRPEFAEQPGFVLTPKLMLPNSDYLPTPSAQRAVDAAVAGLVAGGLVAPELGVGLGPGRVPGAAVPKTAVDKHRGPQFRENKVRFARQIGAPPPARDAIRPENLDQPQLGVPVA